MGKVIPFAAKSKPVNELTPEEEAACEIAKAIKGMYSEAELREIERDLSKDTDHDG